jgi:hypothetical protein
MREIRRPALTALMNAIVDALTEAGLHHYRNPGHPGQVWSAIQPARTPNLILSLRRWLQPPPQPFKLGGVGI